MLIYIRIKFKGELFVKELWKIYASFFKMGAVTFGGGYAMLPILRREIVEKYKWLSEEEIMDFYAISQGLPGIIAVNVSVFIGYARKQALGAIAAAFGIVTPCIIIISIIASILVGFQDNIYVMYALSSISVCVSALIIDSVVTMWKKGITDKFCFILFCIMFLCIVFTNISPILLVIFSAISGILAKSIQRRGA